MSCFESCLRAARFASKFSTRFFRDTVKMELSFLVSASSETTKSLTRLQIEQMLLVITKSVEVASEVF